MSAVTEKSRLLQHQDLAHTKLSSSLDHEQSSVEIPVSQYGEAHRTGGDLIKSIIYGGLDAVINTESTVAAVFGEQPEKSEVSVLHRTQCL
jgi:hypothetical protein